MNNKKQYVSCLVHGDMWGALNANQLIRGIAERGLTPIMIVSRSTPDETGKPASRNIPSLIPTREAKENGLSAFFAAIDQTVRDPRPTENLTFAQLAKEYCHDGTYYTTDRGGIKGGEQIRDIISSIERSGIKPEFILSGDTLAILPAEIVKKYDCFGTHPGPLLPGEDLPVVQGMHGTARSVMYNCFFDANGRYINDTNALGWKFVKGSFFNLAAKLDDGPVIAEGLTPYVPGMCLFQLRADLYHTLIEIMLRHVDQLADPAQRQKLLQEKKAAKPHGHSREIPPLTEAFLLEWLLDGTIYRREPEYPNLIVSGDHERMELAANEIMSESFLRGCIATFLAATADRKLLNYVYDQYFAPAMRRVPKTIYQCRCNEDGVPGVENGVLTIYPALVDKRLLNGAVVVTSKQRDHFDGHWERTSLVLPKDKPNAKAISPRTFTRSDLVIAR